MPTKPFSGSQKIKKEILIRRFYGGIKYIIIYTSCLIYFKLESEN